jgi:molybdopterin molybdotransferase
MPRLPDYVEALSCALARIEPLGESESVSVDDAAGRALCEPITADRDLPPFNRATMDGYALRASEVGVIDAWPIVADIPAGGSAEVTVPPGHGVRIATGAPLPADVDAVIEHELSDRSDPVRFQIDSIETGRSVHRRGADARRGETLIEAGKVLRAHHLGIAAAVGATDLTVAKRPRVILLTSGDEVVPIDAEVAPHQIRNSNGPQILELLRRVGAEPIEQRHVRDVRDDTMNAVGHALGRCDLLVTIGGISAGERDHFPDAFAAHGVTRLVEGAAIQPGKPILVGRVESGGVIVGLPGNPVSALVCTCLFVDPIVRAMLGLDPELPWRDVVLAEAVRPNPRRRAFRPAMVDAANRVTVPVWAGSGDLTHTARTDGVVELPIQAEEVRAGTHLRFLPWP